MVLTCGIQALYDNNREVWFASGLGSAGQQLYDRRCLWDDVTTLQNRHNQFAAVRGGRRESQSAVHTSTHTTVSHLTQINRTIKSHFGILAARCYYFFCHMMVQFCHISTLIVYITVKQVYT